MIGSNVCRKEIKSRNRLYIYILFLMVVTLMTGCYTEERIDRVMELFIVQDNTVGDEIKGYSGSVLPRGATAKLQAFAVFDDGKTGDVSEQVNWESAEPDIVKVDEKGNIEALVISPAQEGEEPTLFEVDIIASKHGVSTSYTVLVTNAVVEFIELSPPRLELSKGNQATLIATGIYTDGLSRVLDEDDGLVWESNAPNIAFVSANGIVSANSISQGGVYITASIGEVTSTAEVIVRDRALTSLRIVPDKLELIKDMSFKFAVIGTYTDGSEEEVTADNFVWESTSPDVGIIFPSGIVSGGNNGSTSIVIRLRDSDNGDEVFRALSQVTVRDAKLTGIQISPEADVRLPVGFSQDFKAIGYFDDDSEPLNITTSVNWVDSSNGAVVQIDDSGVLTGASVGTADIHAELADVSSNTSSVIIDDATLTELRLTPLRAPALPINHSYVITAEGMFSNGRVYDVSSLVTWRSSVRGVVAIDRFGAGVVTGLSEGTTEISAALNGLVSEAPSEVEVIGGELETIVINAESIEVNKGLTTTLEALGIFSDGNIVPITDIVKWKTSDPSVMTITNGISIGGSTIRGGVATGQDVGEATVWAEAPTDGIGDLASNRLDMSVSEALLEEITVVGEEESIPVGLARTYIAMGKFSDETTKELTEDDVYWITAHRDIATVDSESGEIVAHQVGVTELKAVARGVDVEGAISVSVSKEELTDVYMQYPDTGDTIARGESMQLTLFGEYTDGIDRDITTESFMTWSVVNDGNSHPPSVDNNGLVETNSSTDVKAHTIRAKVSDVYGGFSDTRSIIVRPREIVGIEIYVPSYNGESSSVGKLFHNYRGTVNLQVRLVYSDGTVGSPYNNDNVLWGVDVEVGSLTSEGEFSFVYDQYEQVNDIDDRTDNRSISSVMLYAYDVSIKMGIAQEIPIWYLTQDRGLLAQKDSVCQTIGYGYFFGSGIDSSQCYSALSTENYLVMAPTRRELTGIEGDGSPFERYDTYSSATLVCALLNREKKFGLDNWTVEAGEDGWPIQPIYHKLFKTYSSGPGKFLTRHWPNGVSASGAAMSNRRGYRYSVAPASLGMNWRRGIYYNVGDSNDITIEGSRNRPDYISCSAEVYQ